MSITSIFILIIIFLVVSVIGSIIFTKKEQAASLKRQQIASYRLKADEAQDLYDGLITAGLDKMAYHFLLDRIIANLKAAYNINASATGIKVRLNAAKAALDSLDSTAFTLQMPTAMLELHGLVTRLNKLVKYIVILYQKRIIPEPVYQQLMPSVQKTLIRFDAEGHIKMGHQAANDGQPGTAKQSYLYAKEKLIEFGIEDPYVQQQLEIVEELIQSLEPDAKPATASVEQTEAQIPLETTEINDEQSSVTSEEAAIEDAVASQAALNQQSESDGSFTPKKKW